MEDVYRIPKVFYDDHRELDLETPEIVKSTEKHYWISAKENSSMAEFRSNAEFYAAPHIDVNGSPYLRGLVASARATLKIIGGSHA